MKLDGKYVFYLILPGKILCLFLVSLWGYVADELRAAK